MLCMYRTRAIRIIPIGYKNGSFWWFHQLAMLSTGAHFTNILWAAFAPKSFCPKITKPNCKHLKAVQRALVWLSISPTFYKQLFHTKVLCVPFMCLQFGFVFFWRKDFGAKAAHKMLVKLTPGKCHFGHYKEAFLLKQIVTWCNKLECLWHIKHCKSSLIFS